MTPFPNGWAMERRVTLALLLALFLQAAGGLIWAGATAQRLEALEGAVDQRAPTAERLARLEEQVAQARQQLDRIETRLNTQ